MAETLYFGQAAAWLNILVPALSTQIRVLDEDLGVIPIQRKRGKVALAER